MTTHNYVTGITPNGSGRAIVGMRFDASSLFTLKYARELFAVASKAMPGINCIYCRHSEYDDQENCKYHRTYEYWNTGKQEGLNIYSDFNMSECLFSHQKDIA